MGQYFGSDGTRLEEGRLAEMETASGELKRGTIVVIDVGIVTIRTAGTASSPNGELNSAPNKKVRMLG